MFGLTPQDIETIRAIFKHHSEIEQVVIFGSRAMGNYKPGSDVDLAIKGFLNIGVADQISAELNEHTPLPYKFDVVDYSSITDLALLQHIDTHGKLFYQRTA